MTDIERATKWNKEHPERRKEIVAKDRLIHHRYYYYPEQQRDWHLKKNYGISSKEYEELFLKQDGKCAVCGKDNSGVILNGKRKRMYVDHDHVTGKVRGLLCKDCNSALGFVHDNPEILSELLRYIGS